MGADHLTPEVAALVSAAAKAAAEQAVSEYIRQLGHVGDKRRRYLSIPEAIDQFHTGRATLIKLTKGRNPKVRAQKVPGRGHGGKTWRLHAEDLEKALGAGA